MISFEERERIRDRATGRIARWLGIAPAADMVRLLDELEAAQAERESGFVSMDEAVRWFKREHEVLLADLAAAKNRARDAEKRADDIEQCPWGECIGKYRAGKELAGWSIWIGDELAVSIDPNVRTSNNETYAGFDEVNGELPAVGQSVIAFELESGVSAPARVTRVSDEDRLIYLAVEWDQLRSPEGAAHA